MVRHRPWPLILGLAALAYGVLLGATGLGELHPWLRIVNGLVAGGAILAYLLLAPRRADRIDAAYLAALLVFLVAALLSAHPRQSLDAALGALTWAAAFFLARVLLADPTARVAAVRVLIGLSVVLTLVAAARWLPETIEWWRITGVTPPLDMNRSGVLWGHRHDLALLTAVLAPAWWVGPRSPLRTVAGIVFTGLAVVVVVVDGSRTNWLALLVAGAFAGAPHVLGRWRPGRRALAIGASAAVAALVLGVATGVVPALLDRLLTTNTLVSRADMWGALLESWAGQPVAGAGPGSFAWLLQGTDYFSANSWAPRHPDSLPFQLLPEVGLVGVVAVGILAVALAPAVWRGGPAPRFALGALTVAGLGSNPTEFGFFVLVGIAWAALAAPNTEPPTTLHRRWPRVASVGLLAIVGIAFASTALAALVHDEARRDIARADTASAAARLETATALDPGMALYHRMLGAARFLAGDSPGARAALERAVALNPNDDLAWRTLALVQAEGPTPDEALATIGRAVTLQRSDPTNLLLQLSLERRSGATRATDTAGEILHAWPWLVVDDDWPSVVGDSRADALDAAVTRAGDRRMAPQSNALQAVWIAALSGDASLVNEAIRASGLTRSLGEAYARAITCAPSTAQELDAARDADRRFDEYWALRVRAASLTGTAGDTALRALEIMTGRDWDGERGPLNPLDENDPLRLSADTWGYRRPAVTWPDLVEPLPDPDAAYRRWLLDPTGAAAAADVPALEPCR